LFAVDASSGFCFDAYARRLQDSGGPTANLLPRLPFMQLNFYICDIVIFNPS
jgi:hypothetical protein